MTSSILRIIQAASAAAETICSLTANGSIISLDFIFPILPFITSIPVHFSPFCCFERNTVRVSIGSIPAFSDSVKGIDSKASANFSAANCSLPSNDFAQPLSFVDAYVSGAPPPATICGFKITSFTTINASWTERSTSSTTLCEPPRKSKVTDFGCLHPSTNTHLSSSIFLSSTTSALPKSFSNKSSKFVTILAPVAFASFVRSLSLILLTAIIPAFAK